ncbi:hypothetical protein B0H11DRAFT_1929147 [Mycena galericulata]|nr:hypothetical protein B0H11DRAFT_1929147 [Mycena galericulata]
MSRTGVAGPGIIQDKMADTSKDQSKRTDLIKKRSLQPKSFDRALQDPLPKISWAGKRTPICIMRVLGEIEVSPRKGISPSKFGCAVGRSANAAIKLEADSRWIPLVRLTCPRNRFPSWICKYIARGVVLATAPEESVFGVWILVWTDSESQQSQPRVGGKRPLTKMDEHILSSFSIPVDILSAQRSTFEDEDSEADSSWLVSEEMKFECVFLIVYTPPCARRSCAQTAVIRTATLRRELGVVLRK